VEKRLVGCGLTGAARLGFDLFEAKKSLRLGIRPAVVVKKWHGMASRRFGRCAAVAVWQFVGFFRESTASRQILLAGDLAAGGGSL
jgi:hypothetical protein